MADGSAASRALGVKEGEAVDDAVVAKKIAAKEVEALPVNGGPVRWQHVQRRLRARACQAHAIHQVYRIRTRSDHFHTCINSYIHHAGHHTRLSMHHSANAGL